MSRHEVIGKKSPAGKVAVAIAVVSALVAAMKYFDVQSLLAEALRWIENQGVTGIAVYLILYVSACVLFAPGSVLTLGAGAVYGLLKGFVIVSVASTLGATLAFLVGRYIARDWIAQKVEGKPRFKAIDEAVGKEGWKIVGLTRLSPVFPFNLLNYAYGLTRVSLRDYVIASWIGMMPGTVMYVYIGSLAGSLATLGAEGRTRTAAEWILYGVGLLATVVVTVFVTRIAKRALEKKV